MTQTIVNLGTGGAVLNGQNGSTGGADSNDALYLDWTGLDYVYLPGVASNFLSVPDEAALDITGDIDIRVWVAMDDWTPAVISRLLGKYGVSGQRSYLFDINTAGLLRFTRSNDGTALVTTSATVATGIADGAAKWVRVTFDADNGASGNDVRFFLSDDGLTWTQLGSTVNTAGVATLFNSTVLVSVGADGSGIFPATGKVYRAQVFNGIDGTKVLDIDTSVLTTGAATSFTALTGQTVTINRSTAGRKSVAVANPCWLFGTDDFMQVADNDLLDIGAADSFTVLAVVRQWATVASSIVRLIDKMDGSALNGYGLFTNTTYQASGLINSGSYLAAPESSSGSAGSLSTLGFVKSGVASFLAFRDGNLGTVSTIVRPDVSNAFTLRIGTDRGVNASNTFNGELLAVAVFRRALTAAEITQISAYYQARLS